MLDESPDANDGTESEGGRDADEDTNELAIVTSYLGPSGRELASPCKVLSRVSEVDDAGGGSEPSDVDTAFCVFEEEDDGPAGEEEDCVDWSVSCQAWEDRSRSRRAFTPAGS